MPLTNEQIQDLIDTLKAQIASGVRKVSYGDKLVQYHDLVDLNQILTQLEQQLAVRGPVKHIRSMVRANKGL